MAKCTLLIIHISCCVCCTRCMEKQGQWNLQARSSGGGFHPECPVPKSAESCASLLQTWPLLTPDPSAWEKYTQVFITGLILATLTPALQGCVDTPPQSDPELGAAGICLFPWLISGSEPPLYSWQGYSSCWETWLDAYSPVSRWSKTYASSRKHALNTETSSDHYCMGTFYVEDTWQAFTGIRSQTWRINQVWHSPCFPRLAPSYHLGLIPDVTSARRPSLDYSAKVRTPVSLPIIPPCFPFMALTIILLLCIFVFYLSLPIRL